MSAPLVSIAMPVFNARESISRAVRSLLNQTMPDWELLIVDDGSRDGTAEVLRRFSDPRIRLSGGDRNLGLARRLNQCLDLARGEFLARMDADDVAYPQRLETQVRHLRAHPEIDLLGTRSVVYRGDGEAMGMFPAPLSHEAICARPWAFFPLAHPTWMAHTEWFRRHRYDDSARKAQDNDLLLRSYRTSRFASLEDILLGYRFERISLAKSWAGRRSVCRSHFRQVSDPPTAVMALRAAAVHAARFCGDAAFLALGLDEWAAARKWGRLTPAQIEAWQAVWSRLREDG